MVKQDVAIVFRGPSMREEDEQILEAVYMPPAELGSLYRAAQRKPTAIGIIDGYFESRPAVWHKEILWCLQAGIRVYGAASIGALRAAEMHQFGMRGIGSIFEQYRDGLLEDDDEVAVIHQPAEGSWRPSSDAMVNLRATLNKAIEERILDAHTGRSVLCDLKNLPFPERTYAQATNFVQRYANVEKAESFEAWLTNGIVDVKREDARHLLRKIRKELGERITAIPPNFEFAHTWGWQLLLETEENDSNSKNLYQKSIDTIYPRPSLIDLRLLTKFWDKHWT